MQHIVAESQGVVVLIFLLLPRVMEIMTDFGVVLGLEFVELDLIVSGLNVEVIEAKVSIVDHYRAVLQALVVKDRFELGNGSVVHDRLRPLVDRLWEKFADVNFSALALPCCVLGFEHRSPSNRYFRGRAFSD